MKLVRAWTTLVWLSFNRLLWSGATLMVSFPLIVCALLLARQRYGQMAPLSTAFNRFSHDFAIGVFVLFVAPIIALAYATTSIGGDREDRTLLFLLIRPVPRPLILLGKICATLPLVVGISVASFYGYCRLAGAAGGLALELYLPGVFWMAVAYTCLFHLFAVSFRHSTIVALVYSLFMEFLLGNMPGIIKQVAVNYYVRSMMYSEGTKYGLVAPRSDWFLPLSTQTAEWTLIWISLGSLLLSLAIFQRREFRDLT